MKSRRVCGDIYQLATNEPTWVITANGVFFNNSLFADRCHSGSSSNSGSSNWIYSDNLLYSGLNNSRAQKLPLLSCEFTVDGTTVSMDDFLEDLRYRGPVPSLAVLMAAYTIQSKTVHPWWRGEFTAFTKTGELVTFGGYVKEIPTSGAAAAAASDTID